eukprot:5423657-Heterocapsa_arctica.AAC.1
MASSGSASSATTRGSPAPTTSKIEATRPPGSTTPQERRALQPQRITSQQCSPQRERHRGRQRAGGRATTG